MALALYTLCLLQYITSINAQTTTKPNIVIIIADDLGFNDVGWRGSSNVWTPNLNELRNNFAMELTRFYVTPKCAPTRTSLMTGRYSYNLGMQHDVGLSEVNTCGIEPNINSTYFTERLKACHGYDNYYIGKWHQGEYAWKNTPVFRGAFDYFKGYLNNGINYFNFTYDINNDDLYTKTYSIYDWRENTDILLPDDHNDDYTTNALGDKAIEIITNRATNNDSTPFTLIVAMEAPHGPIHWAPEPYYTRTINQGGPWGNPANTYYTDRRKYATMVYSLDYYVGEIVDALKENYVNGESLWKNTYLFFFSDNGGVFTWASDYPLRGAKSTNFEGGIRVPALISGGLLKPSLRGRVYDGLVHVTDLYATIMDVTGTSHSDLLLDGESLSGLLNPAINEHSRDNLIITADKVDCDATYNGHPLCGGIITDFGADGIFKLVIGTTALVGTQQRFGWAELDNQGQVLVTNGPSQFECDPYNIGLTQPTFDAAFTSTDCANNNQFCLYNLTADPCEYFNLAEDTTYDYYLSNLRDDLVDAMRNQADPFWVAPECNQVSGTEILDFMELTGYWTPYAPQLETDPSFLKANTPYYSGVCTPTFNPTAEPSPAPTNSPIIPNYIYVNDGVSRTWQQSRAYCVENFRSDLASIDLPEEQLELEGVIGSGTVNAWIGMFSEPKGAGTYDFNYVDGTLCPETTGSGCIGGTAWSNGNGPRQNNAGKQCVRMLSISGDFKIDNDKECTDTVPGFLCNYGVNGGNPARTCGISCTKGFGTTMCLPGKTASCSCNPLTATCV